MLTTVISEVQTTPKNVFNKKYLYHYVLYVVVCGNNLPSERHTTGSTHLQVVICVFNVPDTFIIWILPAHNRL